MSTRGDERGVALLAVLGLVLALLPVAAAICIQTHLDGLMQRNHRDSTQAFYAAEAGLAHALAEMQPSLSLRPFLNGPDGVEGTTDDGQLAFRQSPPAGLNYEVRASPEQANQIRLRSTGHGLDDAVREVEVMIAPDDTPFTPGALYIEAPDVDVDLGTRGFSLSGVPGGAESAASAPIAGMTVTSATVAAALRAALSAAPITGVGNAPSVGATSPLEIDSYVTAVGNRLEAVIHSTGPAADTTAGTAASPQLTVIDSTWQITSQVEGFGVLVVRDDVEVTGSLRYGGVVVVAGDLRLAVGGELQVDGTLWVFRNGAAAIDLLGTGAVRYDPGNLRRAALALEGSLYHLPQVVGWREVQ